MSETQDPGPSGWDGSNLVPDYSITPAPGSWQEAATQGHLLSHIYQNLPSLGQIAPTYNPSDPWYTRAREIGTGVGTTIGRMARGTATGLYQDIAGPMHDPNLLQDRYAQGRLTQGLLATGLVGSDVEGLPSFPAWHGSGHEWTPEEEAPFGRFDPEKVDTGEGTQMEGWGLYTSKAQDAANIYRGMGIPGQGIFNRGIIELDGKPVTHEEHWENLFGSDEQRVQAHALESLDANDGDIKYTIDVAREKAEDARLERRQEVMDWDEGSGLSDEDYRKLMDGEFDDRYRRIREDPEIRQNEETADWLENNRNRVSWRPQERGNMYQMWLHPEHEEFLDWDKKFSDQPASVQEKLLKIFPGGRIDNFKDPKTGEVTPAPWMKRPEFVDGRTGMQIYKRLAENLGSDREASEVLDDAGIPGNTYLDNSTEKLPRVWHLGGQPWEPTIAGGASANEREVFHSLISPTPTHEGGSRQSVLNAARIRFEDETKSQNRATAKFARENLDWLDKNEDKITLENNPNETRNYVVFHPRNVSVIDRNGQRFGFNPVDHNPFEDQPVDLTPK